MATSSSWVPEDVVFQILLLLPVASLLRFRAVCKSWLSLIDSSRFISQHTRVHEDYKLMFLCCSYDPSSSAFRFRFIFSLTPLDDVKLSKYVEFSPQQQDCQSCRLFAQNLIASYDGIVCLKHTKPSRGKYGEELLVSLLNPATKEYSILPPLQLQADVFNPSLRTEFGFGFDAKTNDYKVVRLILQYPNNSLEGQVEVYSLSTDSWRVIDAVVPLKFCVTSNPQKPFMNDTYCWLGYSGDYSILYFNFSNEAFGIIPMPRLYTNSRPILTFLREKLVCVDWVYDSNSVSKYGGARFRVWVLDEYGATMSWNRLYKVTLDPLFTPLGISMDGKLFFKKIHDHQKLHFYDPKTQQVIDFQASGRHYAAAMYKESLVSVKSANGITWRVTCEL